MLWTRGRHLGVHTHNTTSRPNPSTQFPKPKHRASGQHRSMRDPRSNLHIPLCSRTTLESNSKPHDTSSLDHTKRFLPLQPHLHLPPRSHHRQPPDNRIHNMEHGQDAPIFPTKKSPTITMDQHILDLRLGDQGRRDHNRLHRHTLSASRFSAPHEHTAAKLIVSFHYTKGQSLDHP